MLWTQFADERNANERDHLLRMKCSARKVSVFFFPFVSCQIKKILIAKYANKIQFWGIRKECNYVVEWHMKYATLCDRMAHEVFPNQV